MTTTAINPDTRLDELMTLFHERARLARTFGMRLSFNDQRQGIITLPYNRDLDHGFGGIHGGVYMTLLDTAAWFTSAAAHPDSVWVATSELTTHLLKPVYECELHAVGTLLQTGSRLDIAEAHLYDAEEHLVAHAVGTLVVLPHLRTDHQGDMSS
ncbi:MAG: PaaI family thioesterase [Anaerolineae bacterium]|nr:PaaI family thioesterase [Anaerolineae bacterium]